MNFANHAQFIKIFSAILLYSEATEDLPSDLPKYSLSIVLSIYQNFTTPKFDT